MCLAKAYVLPAAGPDARPSEPPAGLSPAEGRLVMENVARLEVEDGSVRLQSLFGENKVMRGHIASIDFTEGRLLLRIVEE